MRRKLQTASWWLYAGSCNFQPFFDNLEMALLTSHPPYLPDSPEWRTATQSGGQARHKERQSGRMGAALSTLNLAEGNATFMRSHFFDGSHLFFTSSPLCAARLDVRIQRWKAVHGEL